MSEIINIRVALEGEDLEVHLREEEADSILCNYTGKIAAPQETAIQIGEYILRTKDIKYLSATDMDGKPYQGWQFPFSSEISESIRFGDNKAPGYSWTDGGNTGCYTGGVEVNSSSARRGRGDSNKSYSEDNPGSATMNGLRGTPKVLP